MNACSISIYTGEKGKETLKILHVRESSIQDIGIVTRWVRTATPSVTLVIFKVVRMGRKHMGVQIIGVTNKNAVFVTLVSLTKQ